MLYTWISTFSRVLGKPPFKWIQVTIDISKLCHMLALVKTVPNRTGSRSVLHRNTMYSNTYWPNLKAAHLSDQSLYLCRRIAGFRTKTHILCIAGSSTGKILKSSSLPPGQATEPFWRRSSGDVFKSTCDSSYDVLEASSFAVPSCLGSFCSRSIITT